MKGSAFTLQRVARIRGPLPLAMTTSSFTVPIYTSIVLVRRVRRETQLAVGFFTPPSAEHTAFTQPIVVKGLRHDPFHSFVVEWEFVGLSAVILERRVVL